MSDTEREMATHRMAEINMAKDVLSDEKQRTWYNAIGILPIPRGCRGWREFQSNRFYSAKRTT